MNDEDRGNMMVGDMLTSADLLMTSSTQNKKDSDVTKEYQHRQHHTISINFFFIFCFRFCHMCYFSPFMCVRVRLSYPIRVRIVFVRVRRVERGKTYRILCFICVLCV